MSKLNHHSVSFDDPELPFLPEISQVEMEVCEDYRGRKLTQAQIASKHNITRHQVRKILMKHGLQKEGSKRPRKTKKNKDTLGFWGHIKEAFKSLTH